MAVPSNNNVNYSLRNDFLLNPELARHFSPAVKWQDSTAPRIEWLVADCFAPGTVSLVSGDGGLGKSLLMQQLCTAAVLGRDWLGIPTRRVKTYAMFCEDDEAELQRRQERINRHYGCTMGDLEDVSYLARPGQYSVLCEFEKWGNSVPKITNLFMLIWSMSRGAQLIVLDTASDVFGGNEIAKDQVRGFLTLLRRLAIERNACVILTAHVSNEGLASESGLSGSRAWRNSVRRQLWLAENKEGLWLRGMKSNSGPRGLGNDPKKGIPLRWQQGVFVRTDTPPLRDYSEPTLATELPL